jgi:hypothetical protein
MRAAWHALEQEWAATIDQAGRLTEEQRHHSVDGQWSFISTLRHLVFARDKWFTSPILGVDAFDAIGLPNAGSAEFGWPGLDCGADPPFGEVVEVRARQADRFRDYLDNLTSVELGRTVSVLENGATPVNECLYAVFEEEFHHNRYARRDLAYFA